MKQKFIDAALGCLLTLAGCTTGPSERTSLRTLSKSQVERFKLDGFLVVEDVLSLDEFEVLSQEQI